MSDFEEVLASHWPRQEHDNKVTREFIASHSSTTTASARHTNGELLAGERTSKRSAPDRWVMALMATAMRAQRALAAETCWGGESEAVVFPTTALVCNAVLFEPLTGDAVGIKDSPPGVEAVVSIHVDEEATAVVTWHNIIVAAVRLACILIGPCMRDLLSDYGGFHRLKPSDVNMCIKVPMYPSSEDVAQGEGRVASSAFG